MPNHKSLKNCFFICSAFFKPKSQAGGGEILLKFSLTSLEDLFKQPRKKNNNNPLDYTVIFFGPLALWPLLETQYEIWKESWGDIVCLKQGNLPLLTFYFSLSASRNVGLVPASYTWFFVQLLRPHHPLLTNLTPDELLTKNVRLSGFCVSFSMFLSSSNWAECAMFPPPCSILNGCYVSLRAIREAPPSQCHPSWFTSLCSRYEESSYMIPSFSSFWAFWRPVI